MKIKLDISNSSKLKLFTIALITFNVQLSTFKLYGQYGFGTNQPNNNSVLHLVSPDSSQGLIIPLVTNANRPVAASAIKGMVIYNLNDSAIQYCDGNRWVVLHPDSLIDNDWLLVGDTLYSGLDSTVVIRGGNVGINSLNPNAALDVNGNTHLGATSADTTSIKGQLIINRYSDNASPELIIDNSTNNRSSEILFTNAGAPSNNIDYNAKLFTSNTRGGFNIYGFGTGVNVPGLGLTGITDEPVGTTRMTFTATRATSSAGTSFTEVTDPRAVLFDWMNEGQIVARMYAGGVGNNYTKGFSTVGSIYAGALHPGGFDYPEYTLAAWGTDGLLVPFGTTAQRPADTNGVIRFNTDSLGFEGHDGTNWRLFAWDDENDNDWVLNQDTLYSAPDSTVVIKGGNVGIGRLDPSQELDVNGSIILQDNLYFKSSNNYIRADQATGVYLDFGLNGNILSRLRRIGSTSGQYRIYQYSTGNSADNYPGYSFDSDENTGMLLFDDDQLGFSTGGDTKLLIDEEGNVGIGTISPTNKLHVIDSAGDPIKIYGLQNDITLDTVVTVDVSGVLHKRSISSIGDSLSSALEDHDWYEVGGTSTPNTITDNIYTQGNVGIGTSTPEGNLHTYTNAGVSVTPLFERDVDGYPIVLRLANRDTGGDDGAQIGFWSRNQLGTDMIMGHLGFIETSNVTGSETTDITFRPFNNGGYNEVMRMKGNGYIGIGTLNPVEKLEVMDGGIRSTNSSTGNFVSYSALGSADFPRGGYLVGDADSSFTNAAFWVAPASTSQITTTMEALTNANTIDANTKRIGLRATSTETQLYSANGLGNTGDVPLKIYPNGIGGNAALTVLTNGNVGVGTVNPSNRLHVSSASDPMKLEGLQNDATLDTVVTVDSDGVLHKTAVNDLSDGDWTIDNDTLYSAHDSAMVIKGGNVGIGTTNPEYLLDVNGNAHANKYFVGPVANYDMEYHLGHKSILFRTPAATSSDSGWVMQRNGGANNKLWFGVDDNYSHVVGSRNLKLAGGNGGINPVLPVVNYVEINSAGDLHTTGNIGIGTTSAQAAFHVIDSAGDPIKIYGLQNDITLDTVVTVDASGVLHKRSISSIGDSLSSALEDHDWYEVGGTSTPDNIADNIYTEGKVAIGTNNPGQNNLYVYGSIAFSRNIQPATNGTAIIRTVYSYNQGEIELVPQGSTSPTTLSPNGGVYIGNKYGRVPAKGLSVTGDVVIGQIDIPVGNTITPEGKLHILSNGTTSSTKALVIDDNDTNEIFTILDTGFVGIGTTNPLNKLHVLADLDPVKLEGLQNDATLDTVVTIDADGVLHKTNIDDINADYVQGEGVINRIAYWASSDSLTSNSKYQVTGIGLKLNDAAIQAHLSLRNVNSSYPLLSLENSVSGQVTSISPQGHAFFESGVRIGDNSWNGTYSSLGTDGVKFRVETTTIEDGATAASGTLTNAVMSSFARPTLTATNSNVTTTNAATVYIENGPLASTNQTITNPYALWIDDGITRFDGNVGIGTESASQELHVEGGLSVSDVGDVNDVFIGNLSSAGSEHLQIGGKTIRSMDHGGRLFISGDNIDLGGSMYLYGRNHATYPSALHFRTSNSVKMVVLGNGRVGIGTLAPDTNLHIEGSIKMVDGNQSNGYIMQSDVNGVGTWVDPSTIITANDNDWKLTNDTLYSAPDSTVFIGNSKVGIGTTAPSRLLDVEGHMQLDGSLYLGGQNAFIRPVAGTNYSQQGRGLQFNTQIGTQNTHGFYYTASFSAYSYDNDFMRLSGSFGEYPLGVLTPRDHAIIAVKNLTVNLPTGGDFAGFLYDPTITSLAGTHHAIETRSGDIYQTGGSLILDTLSTNTSGVANILWHKNDTVKSGSFAELADSLNNYLANDNDWTLDGDTLYSAPDSTVVIKGGNVGIGTINPSSKIHAFSSSEQLRLGYDASNYASFTTNASGDLTIAPTGNDVTVEGNVKIPKTTTTQGAIYLNGIRFMHAYDNGVAGFDRNTFVGSSAGNFSGTGINNVGFGRFALSSFTSGNGNVALGYATLRSITSGVYNIAIGYETMESESSGSYNIAVGTQNLSGTSNNWNTVIGFQSAWTGSNQDYNTVIGGNALMKNDAGDRNVAIGFSAGRYITGGVTELTNANQSIFIGTSTKAKADSETNQIVIGYNATGEGSNSVVLGNGSITKTILKGNVGVGITSPDNKLHVSAASDPVKLEGLQNDASLDTVLVADADGVIHKRSLSTAGYAALTAQNADYVATISDEVILVDASSGDVTITLPSASGITGKRFHIKKDDVSANFAILDGDGAETIDGNTTQTTNVVYGGWTIVSDGSNWKIIGRY